MCLTVEYEVGMVYTIALMSAHQRGRAEPEISIAKVSAKEVGCLISLCEISMAAMSARLCVRHFSSKLYRKAGVTHTSLYRKAGVTHTSP